MISTSCIHLLSIATNARLVSTPIIPLVPDLGSLFSTRLLSAYTRRSGLTMAPTQYPLSVNSWRSGRSSVVVLSQNTGQIIGSFPLDFVRDSGNDSWQYILWALAQLVESTSIGTVELKSEDGHVIDTRSEVHGGTFYYHCSDSAETTVWSRGPEYFRTTVPPNSEGSLSTRSNSKRSSVHQSRFRDFLIARDGTCLLTDAIFTDCTASHIIPYSNPQLYQRILDLPYEPPLFEPSVGLLLRDDMHHSFDRLEWSLYHKDGIFFIHFFLLRKREARSLHGKALQQDRFRGPDDWQPDVRLINFHYQQCLMAHIRGFSAGFDE